MKLTVFYDGQYWIGVAEQSVNGQLKAVRHIFGGSEPGDPEVYTFVLYELFPLLDRERKRLLRRARARTRHRGH